VLYQLYGVFLYSATVFLFLRDGVPIWPCRCSSADGISEDGLPLPPYAVYNIGGGQPENLLDYISTLQEELVRATVLPEDYDFEGHRELVGMQPGDVPVTYADSEALERDYGFRPTIGIRDGLRKFAEWYKGYYKA
jgi:UDP-glucuronate 4-epimerase